MGTRTRTCTHAQTHPPPPPRTPTHAQQQDSLDSVEGFDARVVQCLQDYRDELATPECRAQVHVLTKRASQDIRFDEPLADACFEDRTRLCDGVQPVRVCCACVRVRAFVCMIVRVCACTCARARISLLAAACGWRRRRLHGLTSRDNDDTR